MIKLLRRIRGAAFPQRCTACGKMLENDGSSPVFCPECYGLFEEELALLCPACKKPFDLCKCEPERFFPDGFAYCFPYGKIYPRASSLIRRCKSSAENPAFYLICESMVKTALENRLDLNYDFIINVPRSSKNLINSGVDQAEELARVLSKALRIQHLPILSRHSSSPEQKQLSSSERNENSASTYYLSVPTDRLEGRSIILVDDVVTVGATVNACTEILKNAGAKSVFCLCAAKNIPSLSKD